LPSSLPLARRQRIFYFRVHPCPLPIFPVKYRFAVDGVRRSISNTFFFPFCFENRLSFLVIVSDAGRVVSSLFYSVLLLLGSVASTLQPLKYASGTQNGVRVRQLDVPPRLPRRRETLFCSLPGHIYFYFRLSRLVGVVLPKRCLRRGWRLEFSQCPRRVLTFFFPLGPQGLFSILTFISLFGFARIFWEKTDRFLRSL